MSFAAALSHANTALLASYGEVALGHTRPTIDGVDSDGIYSAPYQAANTNTGMIESYAPAFAVLDAAAAAVAHDSVVVVRGVTYYVIGIQPDGAGMTNLILSEETGA